MKGRSVTILLLDCDGEFCFVSEMIKLLVSMLVGAGVTCAEEIVVYMGTGGTEGIFVTKFDEETGQLGELKNAVVSEGAGALAASKDGKFIYAIGREKGKREGFVASFQRGEDDGLKLVGRQSSGGVGPCYISLDNSEASLFVANYGGGSVSSFSLSGGEISEPVSHFQYEGKGTHEKRQRRPHAHSILSSPDGKFVYAADLGRDKVEIYQLDVSSGKLTPVGNADVPAGSGPRHMAFSHNGERLYVLNELTLTVSKYARDVESGGLQLEETVAVMAKVAEGMTCSEIELSEDGKFLYAGVRDLKNQGRDLVSVMSLDAEGDMKLVQEHASGTWIPRHLEISPSGKWVLVAGQKGNKLVVHARDTESGKLSNTEHSVEIEGVSWVLFP